MDCSMKIHKVPLMNKKEYDELINTQYISRIGFTGEYPYIAPFIYVFDGDFIYFLSTKYGTKIQRFENNPNVAVEIEKFDSDLSNYSFVTLQGKIKEVKDPDKKLNVQKRFLDLICSKSLSKNILAALGHSPDDDYKSLLHDEKSYVWKLVDVTSIVGIKNR